MGAYKTINFLLILAGIALLVLPMVLRLRKSSKANDPYNYGGNQQVDTRVPGSGIMRIVGAILLLGNLIAFILLATSVVIAPTYVGVVENMTTGSLSQIGSGTRIWPADPNIVPFTTNVYPYMTSKSLVKIGENEAIDSASNSVGNPSVEIQAQFMAMVNPAKVIELHRQYRGDYLTVLVEKSGVDAIKTVQGKYEYNYIGENRGAFSAEVLKELQAKLLDSDGQPLIFVSDVAIINYKYPTGIQAELDTLSKKEFELNRAEAEKDINLANQAAAAIAADTAYNTAMRAAEAANDTRKLAADTAAYEIATKSKAEADGIRQVQAALADAPEGYLEYQRNQRWNGTVPGIVLGDSGVTPFMEIPTTGVTPAEQP